MYRLFTQAEHAQVIYAMNKCTKLRKIASMPRKIWYFY